MWLQWRFTTPLSLLDSTTAAEQLTKDMKELEELKRVPGSWMCSICDECNPPTTESCLGYVKLKVPGRRKRQVQRCNGTKLENFGGWGKAAWKKEGSDFYWLNWKKKSTLKIQEAARELARNMDDETPRGRASRPRVWWSSGWSTVRSSGTPRTRPSESITSARRSRGRARPK